MSFRDQSELEEAEEYLRAGETREEHLTGELDKEREREERLKVEVIDVLSELAEVKNALARRRMADEAEERQAERGRQLLEDAEKELESISSELAYTTGCLEELNSQKENLLQEMAKVKEQLEHARDQLARLYDAQRELEREAHANL